MAFPGPKVHRASRRKLGKGQHPQPAQATCVITASTDDLILTFDVPVVVSGVIPVTTSSGTLVSQTIVSTTVVRQTFNASQAAATVSLASNPLNVNTYQGGGVAPFTATF